MIVLFWTLVYSSRKYIIRLYCDRNGEARKLEVKTEAKRAPRWLRLPGLLYRSWPISKKRSACRLRLLTS